MDMGVDDQGLHGGDGGVAQHAKALLADQVARHGDADGGAHAGGRTRAHGERQGGDGGADGFVAGGAEQHIACGPGRAGAQQGIGGAADGVDRHGTGAAQGQTDACGAEADGGRGGHRNGIDAVAADHRSGRSRGAGRRRGKGQCVALATGIHQLPAQPGLHHRDGDLGRLQRPAAVVGIIFVAHEQLVARADVAVNAVGLAAACVAGEHAHGVALHKPMGAGLHLLPALGVAVVFLGQINLQIAEAAALGRVCADEAGHVAGALEAVERASVLAGSDANHIAIEKQDLAGFAAEVPGQAFVAAVQRRGMDQVHGGQLQARGLQRTHQGRLGGRVGKVWGQAPAAGVAEIFFPECNFFLHGQGLPVARVGEVFGGNVQALTGAEVLVELASQTTFLGRPKGGGDHVVAAHQDDIAVFHVVPGLAFDAFAVFGAVVLGHTTVHIDASDLATGAVAIGHLDGVARLDGLHGGDDFAPVGAAGKVGLGQVHFRIQQSVVGELVNAVIAGDLASAVQHFHAHLGVAAGGGAQHAAGHGLAQLHHGIAGEVVPLLTCGAAAGGSLARVGQGAQGIGAQAGCLHRRVVELLAVHAAGDGMQGDAAAACEQVGAHHIGQHIGVDAVEGQRQADGHRSGGTGTRERGRQGGRTGDGVNGGKALGAHRDLPGFYGQRRRGIADHPGLQGGTDAVFRIGTRGTQAKGAATAGGTDGGRSGKHRGLDFGAAEHLQVERTGGPHLAVNQLGTGNGRIGAVADQVPLALVGVVLVDQIDAIDLADRVADVFVNIVAHQGRVEQHALALDQIGELVVLVVGAGLVVVRDGYGGLANQVARHRQAHSGGRRRGAHTHRHRGCNRAQVGINQRIIECLDRYIACSAYGEGAEGGPLGIGLGRAGDAVECQGARRRHRRGSAHRADAHRHCGGAAIGHDGRAALGQKQDVAAGRGDLGRCGQRQAAHKGGDIALDIVAREAQAHRHRDA